MRNISRSLILVVGAFNPPTKGHAALFDYATDLARRTGGDVRVYPAYVQDARSNPLPFLNKVRLLRKFFPAVAFNDDPAIRSEWEAVQDGARRGYSKIVLLTPPHRRAACERIGAYLLPRNSPKYIKTLRLPIQLYQVVCWPAQHDPDRNETGWSEHAMRQCAMRNDFETFARAVPDHIPPHEVRNFFTQVRQYMGLRDTFQVKRGQFAVHLREDEGSDTYIHLGGGDEDKDTEADRIRKTHQQELIAMKQRQTSELNAAKMRDVQRKAREAQMKVTKSKGPSAA